MEKLMESLGEIERGVADLNCAQSVLANVSDMLTSANGTEEAAEYMDLLYVASGFLDSVVAKLDAAAGMARAAAKALG